MDAKVIDTPSIHDKVIKPLSSLSSAPDIQTIRRPSQIAMAATATILAVTIFVIDVFSTMQIAIAALYVVVLVMALRFSNLTGIILITIGCAILTIAGYLIGHIDDPSEGPMLRCIVSLFAIGIAAVLCVQVRIADIKIRRSEERYRNIFQTTSVAVWEQDYSQAANECASILKQGIGSLRDYLLKNEDFLKKCLFLVHTIDANASARQLIGDLNASNHRASWSTALLPETLVAFREILIAYLDGQPSLTTETAIRRPDGERRVVIVTATFPAERSKSVLINALDITAKINAEQALQESMAELTRVSRIATLGALTASIGHEVNQPLAAVVTNGEAALRWLSRDKPDLDEVISCINEVAREGRRAADIIHRLRSLAIKGEPARGPVEINAIITQVLAMIQHNLASQQITPELALTSDLPIIVGDGVQLQQVVMNLVNNAVHAMQPMPTKQLHITSELGAKHCIRVSVRDSGPGISEDHRMRLFAPFFTTKAEGMGIGLSISRSIIESHHGQIWAESNETGGTTFRFVIPTTAQTGSDDLA